MSEQQDYDRFLAEYGFRQDEVQRLVENESDQVPMPDGFERVQTRESKIHGKGVFTSSAVNAGEQIGPARLGDKRTPIGRYANHSREPNMRYVAGKDGAIEAIALRPIGPDEELTVDYRQAAKVNGWRRQPDVDEVIRTSRMRRRGASGAA